MGRKDVGHDIYCRACSRRYHTMKEAAACYEKHEKIKALLLKGYWIGQSVTYTRSLGSDHESAAPYTCDEEGVIVKFGEDHDAEAQALIESEDGARRWVPLLTLWDLETNDIRRHVRPR